MIVRSRAVHITGSATADEEDEDEGQEQCVIRSGVTAAVQRGRGGKYGVSFIPRHRHVTDASLAT